jgi:hypothetical protein
VIFSGCGQFPNRFEDKKRACRKVYKYTISGTLLSEGKVLIPFKRCLLTVLSPKIEDNTVRRFYRLFIYYIVPPRYLLLFYRSLWLLFPIILQKSFIEDFSLPVLNGKAPEAILV